MRNRLLALLIALSFSKTSLSQTQPKEIPVTLNITQWQQVLNGLGKLPLEQAQEIYMSIVAQVNQSITKGIKKEGAGQITNGNIQATKNDSTKTEQKKKP